MHAIIHVQTTSLRMLALSSESCHLVELMEDGDEKPISSTEQLFALQQGKEAVTLALQQRKVCGCVGQVGVC